ncbi:MAG: hypothetical protein AB1585_06445 [Thermodesulfobacteriota bacterium]
MAHFDRAIPPGGEGKVTMTVDLTHYQGPVWKSAVVYSNDPQRPSISISLQGKVLPHIEIRPEARVRFGSGKDEQQEKTLEFISHGQSFQVLKIENRLAGKVSVQLEPIIKERQYQVTVRNLAVNQGYAGVLRFLTSHPQKPSLEIWVQAVP